MGNRDIRITWSYNYIAKKQARTKHTWICVNTNNTDINISFITNGVPTFFNIANI